MICPNAAEQIKAIITGQVRGTPAQARSVEERAHAASYHISGRQDIISLTIYQPKWRPQPTATRSPAMKQRHQNELRVAFLGRLRSARRHLTTNRRREHYVIKTTLSIVLVALDSSKLYVQFFTAYSLMR